MTPHSAHISVSVSYPCSHADLSQTCGRQCSGSQARKRSLLSGAAAHPKYGVRSPVSHKPRKKMVSHESITDFIFAMRLMRALCTALRSPIARSATCCSRCGNSRKDKRMGQRLYPLHPALLRGGGSVRIRLMTDVDKDTVWEYCVAVIGSILRPRHNEAREGGLDGGRMSNPWRDRSNGILANR